MYLPSCAPCKGGSSLSFFLFFGGGGLFVLDLFDAEVLYVGSSFTFIQG